MISSRIFEKIEKVRESHLAIDIKEEVEGSILSNSSLVSECEGTERARSETRKFNLAYFMEKQMEWVTKQARLILPYGMLLTRLFDFIIGENPELQNESYV
ncbi:hypothetical protein Tco_0449774 [Tanacetum coccineum]